MLVQWIPTRCHLHQGNPIIFLCSFFLNLCWLRYNFLLCSIVSLPPLLRLELANSLGEVSSSPPNFPFPLRLATKLLLGKKLRSMVNPTKSWPRASYGWVAWITRLSLHFKGLWASLGIAQFINLGEDTCFRSVVCIRHFTTDLSFIKP